MLKRILDTTEVDMNNPKIKSELETDLKRMDHLKHEEMPKDSDAYKVRVKPSKKTYTSNLYRFIFEIQYGKITEQGFEPKGETIIYQTESLPMN